MSSATAEKPRSTVFERAPTVSESAASAADYRSRVVVSFANAPLFGWSINEKYTMPYQTRHLHRRDTWKSEERRATDLQTTGGERVRRWAALLVQSDTIQTAPARESNPARFCNRAQNVGESIARGDR
jgi:hypothetical protein